MTASLLSLPARSKAEARAQRHKCECCHAVLLVLAWIIAASFAAVWFLYVAFR